MKLPEFLRVIKEVLEETGVLVTFIVAIWVLGFANRHLFPPAGLTFLEGSGLAFPLSWLLDGGHASAILVYLVRGVWKLASGPREPKP
jgi:hypothetical protein